MPIELSCTCGRELNLRDELAGKTIRCPDCGGTVSVPLPAVEVVEDFAEGAPPQPPPLSRRKDDIDLQPPVRKPERPKEPKKKKKKKSVYDKYYGGETKDGTVVAFNPGWFASFNAGIIGGLFTLVIGIIMLVRFITLFLWIRGIILSIFIIVVGLGAILKGLLDLY